MVQNHPATRFLQEEVVLPTKNLRLRHRRTSLFEVFADSRKIGIVVAANEHQALHSAYLATTRRTDSKMDESCDYQGLVVRKLVGRPVNMGDAKVDIAPAE